MVKLKARGTAAVPPKKSQSAYNIFGKEKRAEILAKNPKAKVTAVVKEMAKCWANLSPFKKTHFNERARKGKIFNLIFCRKVAISTRTDDTGINIKRSVKTKKASVCLHDFYKGGSSKL